MLFFVVRINNFWGDISDISDVLNQNTGVQVASKAINEMMPVILEAASKSEELRRKLFQVNFHGTVSGQCTVTLVYHKNLDTVAASWTVLAQALR